MAEPDVNKNNTTKVVTTGSGVRIETPRGKRRQQPRVSVIVGPDEMVGGFLNFLREHAIVGLAVGFAIGAQAQTVVKQLLTSFLDPLFKLVFGQALSTRRFTLHSHGQPVYFGWGALVYTLINFLFVLAAIYIIIKVFNLDKLDKPKDKK